MGRVLTTSNLSNKLGDADIIVNKQVLRETDDYIISGNDITFNVKIFDVHKIDVKYLV